MSNKIDYRNDNSLFSIINIAGSFEFVPNIQKWFKQEKNALYRIIIDREVEDNFYNVNSIQDLYPGVRILAPVTNPWRRAVSLYKGILILKDIEKHMDMISNFDLCNFTFESFLNQIGTDLNRWFKPSTLQSDWLNNQSELVHIIRDDFALEDFKVIQNYFNSTYPINVDFIEYRNYYNETTKKFVEEIYKEDIIKFNYVF